MAKRSANGKGSIRKRKGGRWEGRCTAGRNPRTGKRIYKHVLGRAQAEAAETMDSFTGQVMQRQTCEEIPGRKPNLSARCF